MRSSKPAGTTSGGAPGVVVVGTFGETPQLTMLDLGAAGKVMAETTVDIGHDGAWKVIGRFLGQAHAESDARRIASEVAQVRGSCRCPA